MSYERIKTFDGLEYYEESVPKWHDCRMLNWLSEAKSEFLLAKNMVSCLSDLTMSSVVIKNLTIVLLTNKFNSLIQTT